MLPPEYRLPLGQRRAPHSTFHTPFFTAKLFLSTAPHSRFGFIVSKKVAAEAVVRNRIRRRLRAVIENQLSQIKSGYDILFIIQKDALEAPPASLTNSVLELLRKKGLVT